MTLGSRAVIKAAIVLTVLCTTVACGHTNPVAAPTPVSTPSPTDCTGGRVLTVHGGLTVHILGDRGPVVILSNESDQDRCAWRRLAATLTAAGMRAAVWDYGSGPPPDELSAVAAAVHADTSAPVVLMGASKGAKTSLVAAHRLNASYVVGVVSLSAEAVLSPDIDVASAVAGLRTPTLLVTAQRDPYGSSDALAPIQRGIAGAQALTVPGSDHGTALLADAGVTPAVLSFLHRVTGS
jgi:pimeloyl-ACP methyl ester carboxylesterase